MMRDTPRTFVGSVVFLLQRRICGDVAQAVRAGIGELPGIVFCELDVAAGTLVVTTDRPVDRVDVVAVLDRLGCRVRD